MDMLAAATGSIALTSLLVGCNPGTDEFFAAADVSTSEPTDTELSEPVKIGYIPIADSVPLILAHALGYFEEEGISTEKPTLIRGWSPCRGFHRQKVNLCHLLIPIPSGCATTTT